MHMAKKAVKETGHKCLWQRKKEQTTNACGKERNTKPPIWLQTKNACPTQASKQLTPNERTKTAETTSKPQTVAYLQA